MSRIVKRYTIGFCQWEEVSFRSLLKVIKFTTLKKITALNQPNLTWYPIFFYSGFVSDYSPFFGFPSGVIARAQVTTSAVFLLHGKPKSKTRDQKSVWKNALMPMHVDIFRDNKGKITSVSYAHAAVRVQPRLKLTKVPSNQKALQHFLWQPEPWKSVSNIFKTTDCGQVKSKWFKVFSGTSS